MIKCEICQREFKTQQGLTGHMRFVHGIKTSKQASLFPPKRFITDDTLADAVDKRLSVITHELIATMKVMSGRIDELYEFHVETSGSIDKLYKFHDDTNVILLALLFKAISPKQINEKFIEAMPESFKSMLKVALLANTP